MIAAPYENIQFIQVSTMKKKKKVFKRYKETVELDG